MDRTERGPLPAPGDPEVGWVLYDGDCGICSRWVRSWAPRLARLGLAVAPLQSPWVERRTGLEPGELVRDILLLHRDGPLVSGANVYRYVMRRVWWTYPLYVLSKLPGLSTAFEWGYRTFARHRTRISTACRIPGGS